MKVAKGVYSSVWWYFESIIAPPIQNTKAQKGRNFPIQLHHRNSETFYPATISTCKNHSKLHIVLGIEDLFTEWCTIHIPQAWLS